MQVINELVEESFAYTNEKEDMSMRRDEIGELMEIVAYCQNEAVDEPLFYQDVLWEIYVQKDITFADWLFGNAGAGNEEDKRRLLEALSKKEILPLDGELSKDEVSEREEILISLGASQGHVSKVQDYIQVRRDILASIRNVNGYEAFMRSCFINSCFADGILSGMKHIQDFPERTREITDALGILNDKAVALYQQYPDHLQEAMKILSSSLQRKCTPDPAHAKDLVFTFTYSEQLEGSDVAKVKEIECSPHLKLLHPGSDLRIYFYWCDEAVGKGEKVLVGRIGRHPY